MPSDILERFSASLHASNVTGKAVALAIVLAFFVGVHFLRTVMRKGVSPSKVGATIKLAVLGFLLLALEVQLRGVAPWGELVANAQSLVVALCLANLVVYLVVDVYFHLRTGGQVPGFIRDLLTALVYLVFALAALRVIFRLDVSSLLTTTTVITAAVAFAMQASIANLVSGFYVENDENLRPGTWISVKDLGVPGQIVNVGFRNVTLRTLDGRRVMVPNHQLIQNVVENLGSRAEGVYTAQHLKVGLPYELPPERARALLAEVLRKEPHVRAEPAPQAFLSAFQDSAVEYDLKYFLDDYSSHAVTRNGILSRIWYAVDREGYGIPYPHREVITRAPREAFPVEASEIARVLGATEILGSLPPEGLRALAGVVHRRVYGPGEDVVRQDDEGSSLFVVRRGRLAVRIGDAEVGRLGEGDIFGEMSLLTGERRKATVTAAGEVHLVEIAKEHLEPVLRSNPELVERLSAMLARREEANVEARRRSEQARPGEGPKDLFRERLRAFFGL
jgi:small-conductance mechanosensitive channel/CRP-like cAMP-binding protein